MQSTYNQEKARLESELEELKHKKLLLDKNSIKLNEEVEDVKLTVENKQKVGTAKTINLMFIEQRLILL